MGVRCLIVVVHRSHQASASPIHPTRSSRLPLISRSPKHNNKCRSNHNSKDSHLLGECVSWSHVRLSEWNIGLIYICGLIGSTGLLRIMQAGQGLSMDEIIISFIVINQNSYTKLHYVFFWAYVQGSHSCVFLFHCPVKAELRCTDSYHDLWCLHPNNIGWSVQKWRFLLHCWILHLLLGSDVFIWPLFLHALIRCTYCFATLQYDAEQLHK